MFEELEADYDRVQMKNFPDLEIDGNENNEEDNKIVSEHMKFDSKEGVIQRKVRIICVKENLSTMVLYFTPIFNETFNREDN